MALLLLLAWIDCIASSYSRLYPTYSMARCVVLAGSYEYQTSYQVAGSVHLHCSLFFDAHFAHKSKAIYSHN